MPMRTNLVDNGKYAALLALCVLMCGCSQPASKPASEPETKVQSHTGPRMIAVDEDVAKRIDLKTEVVTASHWPH
jgi:hypothetical protein